MFFLNSLEEIQQKHKPQFGFEYAHKSLIVVWWKPVRIRTTKFADHAQIQTTNKRKSRFEMIFPQDYVQSWHQLLNNNQSCCLNIQYWNGSCTSMVFKNELF